MVLGNVDLSPYPFDGPLPENLPRSNASLQIFEQVTGMARREKLSHPAGGDAGRRRSRQGGHPRLAADHRRHHGGMVPQGRAATDSTSCRRSCRAGSTISSILVIPELRRRGLFRSEYEGKTLRENLGLKRPESRHAKARSGAAAAARRFGRVVVINVIRLGHATLTTPDIDRQIAYYTEVVGLDAGRAQQGSCVSRL